MSFRTMACEKTGKGAGALVVKIAFLPGILLMGGMNSVLAVCYLVRLSRVNVLGQIQSLFI